MPLQCPPSPPQYWPESMPDSARKRTDQGRCPDHSTGRADRIEDTPRNHHPRTPDNQDHYSLPLLDPPNQCMTLLMDPPRTHAYAMLTEGVK